MQLTQDKQNTNTIYRSTYRLPGMPCKTQYTIKLPGGIHRAIWVGTKDMSFVESEAARRMLANALGMPQEATESSGGTQVLSVEAWAVKAGITLVDLVVKRKKKVRKKSARGSKIYKG